MKRKQCVLCLVRYRRKGLKVCTACWREQKKSVRRRERISDGMKLYWKRKRGRERVVAEKPASPMTEAARLKCKEAIRRLRERQAHADEKWLDALADAHGMGQECERSHVVAYLREVGRSMADSTFSDLAEQIEKGAHVP